MKLRQCRCGGTPKLYSGLYGDELRHVECEKCGLATVSYWDGRRAQSNWNWIVRTNDGKET